MDEKKPTIADRLFDANEAECELEELLTNVGIEFTHLGWDWYDCSVEIYGVPEDHRLSIETQKVLYNAGFVKAYVNHLDKWETHYTFDHSKEFIETKGWRVSYPHKRGEGEESIWVEEPIASWPKDWFYSGYCIIKTPVQK